MNRNYFPRSLIIFACLVLSAFAQLEKIVIPAGTPEDQGLQAISKEEDAPKKASMYQEFVQKFSSNPAAVAYGNWQLSQYYEGAGDFQKSLDYGDKALAGENDAKSRMSYIERFTPAFPNSRFEEQVTSYAMVSLSELKDTSRLISFGEKTLAANPNSLPALLLLANTYVDDPKPGSVGKSVTYSQKAILVAKADAPAADRSRKLSAGMAHATLGYAYMKQDKTTGAIPELKTASTLLKGQDDQQYAIAMYRLGFAYAKLNRINEARDVLSEAARISGPVQQPSQDLLAKVNAARAKGK